MSECHRRESFSTCACQATPATVVPYSYLRTRTSSERHASRACNQKTDAIDWCVFIHINPNDASAGTVQRWLAFAFRGTAHPSWKLQPWYVEPHAQNHCHLLTPCPFDTVLLFSSAGDAHDDTLQRIYSAANEDVEMKVSLSRVVSRSGKSRDVASESQDAFIPELYLVLDTNVLIDYLDVMKRFNEDIERLSLPITIIIPNVLLSELDG